MPSGSKTSAVHSASCLWMEYIRLLGSSSALVMALSVLLHASYCELADDSAHWWETCGLVLAALACGLMLCRSSTSAMWYALGGSAFTLAWWLHTRLEHRCDMHGSFLVALGLFQWSAAGAVSWAAAFDSPGPTIPNSNSEPQSELPREPEPTSDPTDQNPPSHRRPWLPIWLLIVGLVIYMVVVPSIAMLVNRLTEKPTMVRQLTDMSLSEYLRLHSVSGVIMCLFLAMGASVGSFLNVVIYRFPRGRALLWPPSACPSCQSRIATRDNIPILAWLNLGGRCRHCGVSISARYPLVEATMAAICVLFYYRELLSGGANLPVRIPNAYHGIVWILLYTKWDLVTIYLFHLLLLALVLVIAFVNLDRFRLPVWSRIALPVGIVALVTLAPHLNPILVRAPAERLMLAAFTTSLIGCAGGALVGWCLARLFPVSAQVKDLATEQSSVVTEQSSVATSDSTGEPACDSQPDLYGSSSVCPSTRTDLACALAMLGAGLGLQAVIALGLGLLILMGLRDALIKLGPAVGQPVPLRHLPITWLLLPLVVAQLALWNWIHLELPIPYL